MGIPASDEDEAVAVENAGSVRRICLNRPEARNAVNLTMISALDHALMAAEGDDGVAAIVIAARGPVFSAGHDLRELEGARGESDRGRALFRRAFRALADAMLRIARSPKPVIAEVDGPAIAAGCLIVAQCDMAVAADTATFSAPGVNLGLFCATTVVPLTRAVSKKAAFEMLFTGRSIDAEHALRIGLVNRVCPAASLRSEVDALAADVASKDPAIIAMGKSALHAQERMALGEAYNAMVETMTQNMLRPEAAGGVGAFLHPDHEPK